MYGKLENIGLQICEGPHKDTQELQIHAFRWFNKHLKGVDPLIETAAVKFFQPQDLKVFQELPGDQVNTKIQETFTQTAEAKIPENADQWAADKRQWRKTLREEVFRGWPTADPASHGGLDVKEVFSGESSGLRLSALDFTSQRPSIRLRLYLAHPASLDRSSCEYVVLHVLDEDGWKGFLAAIQSAFAGAVAGETPLVGDQPALDRLATKLKESRSAAAFIAPRGVGPTAWNPDERKQTQIRRRFMLLGQTRDGMQVWDAARAAVALRSLSDMADTPLRLSGRGPMAGIALYASPVYSGSGSTGAAEAAQVPPRGADLLERAAIPRHAPGGRDGGGAVDRPDRSRRRVGVGIPSASSEEAWLGERSAADSRRRRDGSGIAASDLAATTTVRDLQ